MSSIENAKKIKEIFGCTIPTSFSMGRSIFELTLSQTGLSYISNVPVNLEINYEFNNYCEDEMLIYKPSILSPKVISIIEYSTINMFDGSDEEFESFIKWKENVLDKITFDIDCLIDSLGTRMIINYIRTI